MNQKRSVAAAILATTLLAGTGCVSEDPPTARSMLIAHRGASSYAPEHTLAAYRLALAQGADFIEPDLQITRDGHLIALHDATLERTTDVAEVFPDRFREVEGDDGVSRRWYAVDFTLDEIRTLDAGAWFGPAFAGERIPTLADVIELARGQAGLFPETKAPGSYSEQGFAMERMVLEKLARFGLDRDGADPKTPVIIQSFSSESLRILREELDSDLPLTLLLSGRETADWTSADGLAEARVWATGIGPNKRIIEADPTLVQRAHDAGLAVTPWTFGARDPDGFDALRAEMRHFVCELGVDGLFTNNPDLYPTVQDCAEAG